MTGRLERKLQELGPAWCDEHWKEMLDMIEKDRTEQAVRFAEYYESEGVDTSPDEEYRSLKALDDHYSDLML